MSCGQSRSRSAASCWELITLERTCRPAPAAPTPRKARATLCWPASATKNFLVASPIPGWLCANTGGGRQGQEYPFTLRVVEAPELDEDGEPATTMVVDWLPEGA